MLISFSVENFLSIKERVTLSLVAGARNDESSGMVVPTEAGIPLLTVAAVYGPNGSGKSNFVRKAFRLVRQLVIHSAREGQVGDLLAVDPFRLDEAMLKEPSRFELDFLLEGIRHRYGFALTRNAVQEEYLYNYPKGRERMLFERRPGAPMTFGPSWKGSSKAIERSTRDNALFLSRAAQDDHPVAGQILERYFQAKLQSIETLTNLSTEMGYTIGNVHDDPKLKRGVLHFLAKADTRIVDFATSEPERNDLPPPIQEMMGRTGAPPRVFDVRVFRKGRDKAGAEKPVEFLLGEESDGTQKLFALSIPLLYILNEGACVFFDELEVRLHPLLTRWIIELFNSPETNRHGAQLVFTTHDEGLMDAGLLRRDQIWIMDQRDDGSSALYSLWDFEEKPRKDDNLRKRYLAGRYGGVPVVARFDLEELFVHRDKQSPKPTRRQHFIAQFYLRNFADPIFSDALWYYDLKKRSWEQRSPRGVGWFPHLCSIYDQEGRRTDEFDKYMKTTVEDPAAPALKKLALRGDLLAGEQQAVALFIALTALRSPKRIEDLLKHYRESLVEGARATLEAEAVRWCESMGRQADDDGLKEFYKPRVLQDAIRAAWRIQRELMNWQWHVVYTPREQPFVSSDMPVLAQWLEETKTGLVTFPVSSEVALVLFTGGRLRTERDSQHDPRAMNLGTIRYATEFVVSCTRGVPSDDDLSKFAGN